MLPKDELTRTYDASPPAASSVSSTEMAEPSASQDSAGCRRRGAWSSSTAIATTSRAVPTGQRPSRPSTGAGDQP